MFAIKLFLAFFNNIPYSSFEFTKLFSNVLFFPSIIIPQKLFENSLFLITVSLASMYEPIDFKFGFLRYTNVATLFPPTEIPENKFVFSDHVGTDLEPVFSK